MSFNLNNKTFRLVQNSIAGSANKDTIFKYKQSDDIVTAVYSGGDIKHGNICGTIDNKILNILYQCITINGELKAGKAKGVISLAENSKLMLSLNWQWLTQKQDNGTSVYIEI